MRPSSGALGQDEAVVLQFVTHLQGPAELSFPRLATGRRRPGAGATLPQSSTAANRKGGGEMKKERVAPLSWPPRHDELRHGRPFFPFGVLLVLFSFALLLCLSHYASDVIRKMRVCLVFRN